MNTVSIIGTGYVGLVTGACLSKFGMNVFCMDVDDAKIQKLKEGSIPIYEPGLGEIVAENVSAERLRFTTSYDEAVRSAEIIFIAVGTPPKEDGSADLQHVLSAARAIAQRMDSYKVIVDKSTVPVGTGRKVKAVVKQILEKRGVHIDFDVVANPEFLREGAAVNDFLHPDRIIIGSDTDRAAEMMKKVYHALYLNNHPFVFTGIETAEIIKYASNAFLATKISFINEIAILCEAVGGNVQEVAKGMGLDKRIGKFFLHAGPGYGGSCFPKDTKALVQMGHRRNVNMSIVESVVLSNEAQKLRAVAKIVSAVGDIQDKAIAVLGIAFKPETDDIREAPAIIIIQELMRRGARVRAYDPVAMENAKKFAFGELEIYYAQDEYDAAKGADAIVIVTEWNRFRSLDLRRIKMNMRQHFFFDLRNIYISEEVAKAGFIYQGTGVPAGQGSWMRMQSLA